MESGCDAVDRAMPVHPAWKELDLDAFAANVREVRRLVGPDIKIIASVKANAYGHGAVEIARALRGLDVYSLATSSYGDAVAMREAGIDAKIQMFPCNLPEGMRELLRYDLMPSVYNRAGARAVSEAASTTVPVYVKVDCGLGRLGVAVAEAAAFVHEVAALPRIVVEGVYSHLPYEDAAGREWAEQRLVAFDRLIAALAGSGLKIPVTQVIASAGVAGGVTGPGNAVCVGHLLYGGLAVADQDVADLSPFRPVLRAIKSRLIHIGRKGPGEAIASGGAYVTGGDTTTGVIPVGLYDGYRRPAAGKTATVLMRGKRVPVIRVSLEYTNLDLSGIDGPEIGDEVVVLGASGDQRITVEEMAAWQGSAPLAVLMSFDRRLPSRPGTSRAPAVKRRTAGYHDVT